MRVSLLPLDRLKSRAGVGLGAGGVGGNLSQHRAVLGRNMVLYACSGVCVCLLRETRSSCIRLIPPFILHTDSTSSWHGS